MDLLDDDLVDVVLVLSVLFVCVAALAILLAKHAKSIRRFCHCASEKKEEEITPPHRTTIRVARKAHDGVRSQHGTGITPPPVSPRKDQQFVYIVPKTPTYRQEMQHQTLSPQSSSTCSSYLPSQIAPAASRRLSF